MPYAIAGICERDIDLLLLEELRSCNRFVLHFLELASISAAGPVKVIDAHRSVTHSVGESDLEVHLQTGPSSDLLLLIENKVAASFQRDQAERYRIRGEQAVETHKFKEFCTILVAPQEYLGPNPCGHGFDKWVSYESLREWFDAADWMGPRAQHKSDLLKDAIEKSHAGYVAEADEPMTNFWRYYWRLACEIAPELRMHEPEGRPSGSTFLYFRPVDLEPLHNICHKFSRGYVDLQLGRMADRMGGLGNAINQHLDSDMVLITTGSAATIRIRVPKVDVRNLGTPDENTIRQGITSAQRLHRWYQQNKSRITGIPTTRSD